MMLMKANNTAPVYVKLDTDTLAVTGDTQNKYADSMLQPAFIKQHQTKTRECCCSTVSDPRPANDRLYSPKADHYNYEHTAHSAL